MFMETPLHAANDVDKNENVPRIIAVVAGIAIAIVAAVVVIYSGYWSPPATTASAKIATVTHHAP
jgi:purine-cytosine permease-like protein